jgi:hypothetical protein
MRTLRPTLAGIVVFVLAVSTSGVAVAQDDEDAEAGAVSHKAAAFTGAEFCCQELRRGREVSAEGRVSVEGELRVGDITGLTDPRLNGRLRFVRNVDFHGLQDRVLSVSARIDNELGSWLRSGQGYRDRDFTLRRTVLLRGSGAYDGLSALSYIDDPRCAIAYDGVVVYYGVVFPGELPVTPPLLEPPAE